MKLFLNESLDSSRYCDRTMLGFKTFRCARILIAGIEIMHMIRKGQLGDSKDQASSPATQFYSLAF